MRTRSENFSLKDHKECITSLSLGVADVRLPEEELPIQVCDLAGARHEAVRSTPFRFTPENHRK